MSDARKQEAHSGAVRAPGALENPMLAFDLTAEIEHLRQETGWQAGRNSKTLVKRADFRVVLTVMQSGARLHEHKAPGPISVQTVAGHIRMHAGKKLFDLPVGNLLSLERDIAHDVEALEDSAFLLTIGWAEKSR